jgi:co-chaperonin GroES (HSP10)
MAKKINFKPYGQWILLPNPTQLETDSGIILDEKTARSQTTNILKVVALGPECKFCKVGETVMVDPTVEARVLHLDEGEFILVAEYQILGKF